MEQFGGHIQRIGEQVRGAADLARREPDLRQLRLDLLRWFLNHGCGPNVSQLAEQRHEHPDVARHGCEALQRLDVLTLEGDQITTAYPFSSRPTRHRVRLSGGRSVYALCATDALGIHFMTGEPLTTESGCPDCGAIITCRLEAGRLVRVTPGHPVQYIDMPSCSGQVVTLACPSMNLFCNRAHLAGMLASQGQNAETGEIHELEDVLRHAEWIFGDWMAAQPPGAQ